MDGIVYVEVWNPTGYGLSEIGFVEIIAQEGVIKFKEENLSASFSSFRKGSVEHSGGESDLEYCMYINVGSLTQFGVCFDDESRFNRFSEFISSLMGFEVTDITEKLREME